MIRALVDFSKTRALTVCTHCRAPVDGIPIVWHEHRFHMSCAKKLLIAAEISRDELIAAIEKNERTTS